MVFASPIFLFLFLPLFLALYYLTPPRFRSFTILAGSALFYAWWRVDFLLLLFGIIAASWLIGLGIEAWRGTGRDKLLLWAGVAGNLATLGYFKYANFGVQTLNAALAQAGFVAFDDFTPVLLPIGISFFVFHAISYIVDVWRRDTPATRSFFDFAAFITLFPHLIAGPVLRYKDLAGQFRDRVHSWALFSEGAYRFMCGFCMKVLIADPVALLADAAFALPQPTMAEAWLGALAYSIQLFFDFAGYSVMAVGLALMMGFRFIENFDNPYISASITEFWRRWHISLSTWLRDYLYIPLGGNRKGPVRTYINLFLTMLLGGLWHGANWTFILWGAWHGLILALERLLGVRAETVQPLGKRVVMTTLTMLVVMIGWVMFRAHSVENALSFYGAMAGLGGFAIGDQLAWQIKGASLTALAAGVALVFLMPLWQRNREKIRLSDNGFAVRVAPSRPLQIAIALLFAAAITRLVAMSYSPFLYFQF